MQIEVADAFAMDNAENMNDSTLALLGRARVYCASAEQCASAVRQKLHAWGAETNQTDDIVQRLVDEGYLDEGRYARAYCESKMLRGGWGRRKVAYQLRLKQVAAEAIEAGMAAVDDEAYMAVLEEAARKKMASLKGCDERLGRQRTAAFLAQRGYTTDEINEILTQIKQQL